MAPIRRIGLPCYSACTCAGLIKTITKQELLDQTEGEEAGIKSSTISVSGPYAYGYLRAEKGVHRLVRLSPFDAAHRRHTSFALVEVLPEVNSDDSSILINAEDIRIDVYRSSGRRWSKRPEKTPPLCALPIFQPASWFPARTNVPRCKTAKMPSKCCAVNYWICSRKKSTNQLAELRGEYTKAEWGSQIRSYVLHPYQLVKDHRTEFEMGNTQAGLDGDLNGFIEAYLKHFK